MVPLIKVSATNRFLMNRIGDRGFKKVAEYWMRDQKERGWFGIYALGIHSRSNQKDDVAYCENIHAHGGKGLMADGRMVTRMPFRGSLRSDSWEQSP